MGGGGVFCPVRTASFYFVLLLPQVFGGGGVPFFKKLFLQTGRLQQQTEFIAMT